MHACIDVFARKSIYSRLSRQICAPRAATRLTGGKACNRFYLFFFNSAATRLIRGFRQVKRGGFRGGTRGRRVPRLPVVWRRSSSCGRTRGAEAAGRRVAAARTRERDVSRLFLPVGMSWRGEEPTGVLLGWGTDVSGPVLLLAWPRSFAVSVWDEDVSVNKSDVSIVKILKPISFGGETRFYGADPFAVSI